MMKKLYSVPVKAAAVLLLMISLIGMGIGGYYGALALYVGCYNDSASGADPMRFYENVGCWSEVSEYVEHSKEWDEYSKTHAKPSYGMREDYQAYLTDSNLRAVRIEQNNGVETRTPVFGTVISDQYVKHSYHQVSETTGYEIYLNTSLEVNDAFQQSKELFQEVYPARWNYLYLAGASMLIGIISWIFLLVVAGRSAATGEIVLRGFHRIPFDVITVLFVIVVSLLAVSLDGPWPTDANSMRMAAVLMVADFLAIAVLVMLWGHTAIARIKGKVLLRSTLIGALCIRLWRVLRAGVWHVRAKRNIEKAAKESGEAVPKIPAWEKARDGLGKINWKHNKITAFFAALGRGIRAAIRQLAELFRHMNVVWKLCGAAILVILLLEWLAAGASYDGGMFLCLVVLDILVFLAVGFFALQLDRLKKGGERLANGDLDYKIPIDHMYWDLQQHAKNLNAISDGMAIAVQKQLKSERMKYELLTNVSHDIKTPLTSIINYVDLLHNEPIESKQAQEYIEVLERQSAKLKKLITDLIDVSKATTGNITVHAERTHAGELLRQCVGEYSERMNGQNLETILTVPEDEPSIYADGRLLWRIFDNLLGNIVKYAMPGTRVYIDLESADNRVVISLRNISRERINISSDELMERFVRGDASRATEGSGLGLSIARSLTELMHGRFGLMVDGDLFKIVLDFDKMEN